jgi:hypothetical protein
MINDYSDNFYTDKENFLVVLDSRNATRYLNSTYNSSVIFEFEDSIKLHSKAIKLSCSLNNFTCPNSIYLINEYNCLLSITVLGVTTNYSILYGNYNVTTFISQLKTQLDSNFTITLNYITNKFTITNLVNDFTINKTSTIYEIIGMVKNTAYTSTSKSLALPYTCNFNGAQSINILFENLNTSNIDSFNKSNSSIIQSIPIDITSQQISFIRTNEFNFRIRQDTIDFIQIDIKDDLDRFINLNNQHWNITLQFSETKDYERFHYNTNFHSILENGYSE